MAVPAPRVLDLFAVPDDVTPLPGGRGGSVLAGDLVLSPARDAGVAAWLNPLLARLAVRLDEAPGRRARDLRIAVPVPARDGSWVVEGWGASRYEPDTVGCHDLDVLLGAGRVLHARLAAEVTTRPRAMTSRHDRWSVAERLAFGPADQLLDAARSRPVPGLSDLLARLAPDLAATPVGPDQLVHGDLAGNVLLDAAGAPVVIDVSPYWRPARWAEAVCVLDAAMWLGADPDRVHRWADDDGARDALARAAAFRLLSDDPPDVAAYRQLLG